MEESFIIYEIPYESTMTGVIAGIAILNIPGSEKGRLNVVGLTVNNHCNLDCGYCYLGEEEKPHFVDQNTIRRIDASNFRHLAIVGKEAGGF